MNEVLDKDGCILKAGAIIIKGNKVLLLYRNKWDDCSFPKGHLEPNETIEDCLKREVKEETGLEVEIVKPLPDIIYSYPKGDCDVKIKMFLCEPKGELEIEYQGDKLKWFDFEEAKKQLSYENNVELLTTLKRELNA